MRLTTFVAAALLAPLLGSGCVVTTTHSTTWSDAPAQSWTRYGRVESIRETVRETRGDPAGGAVAGAIIGGLIGSTLGGGPYHHGSAAGAVAGAIGGAVVGANASQVQSIDRRYEAFVRFEDGSTQTFLYAGAVPFRPGEEVVQTEQGLYPR